MSSAGSDASVEHEQAAPGDRVQLSRARARLSRFQVVAVLLLSLAAVGGSIWIQLGAPTGGEYGVLGLLLGASVLFYPIARMLGRSPGAVGFALALLVSAVIGALCADLPEYPSALSAGDSPLAVPVYAGLGLLLVGFFLLNPGSLAAAELIVLALVLFAAGNAKVWTRSNEDFFPLYAGLAAMALLVVPGTEGERRLGPTARRIFGLGIVFLLWIAVCGWRGEDPGRTDELFARLVTGAIGGWATARVLNRAGVERALLMAALSGLTVFLALPALWDASQVLEVGQVLRGTRLRLFGLHPNLTGTFLAVELVLAVGLLIGARGWKRIALGLVLIGTLPALYLSRSRTAWIAAIVGLCVLFLARRVSRRLWIGLLGGAATLFLVVMFVAPVREAVLRPGTSAQSLSQRIYLWDASARLVASSPVFGIGLNNYFAHGRTAATPSYFDNTDKSLHPHNLLLAVAEGSGLAGLAIFLALLGAVVLLAIRCAGKDSMSAQRAPPLGAILLASLATLIGANMFDLGLSQTTFVPTLFWLLAGMAVALERESPIENGFRAPVPSGRLALVILFALVFAVRPFAGERLFRAGIRLQDGNNSSAALEVWSRARSLMPWATGPLIRSAQVAAAAGDADEARELFEQVVDLSPTHPRFRYRYALFLSSIGKPAQAADQCALSLAADPHPPEEGSFRMLFAECLAHAGRGEQAARELDRALLLMPDIPARFGEFDWKLPVKNGDELVFVERTIALGKLLGAQAAEREGWDVRRRGNHLGRIMRQLGEPRAALEMLGTIERATGTLDVSLERLRTELHSDIDDAFEGDKAFRAEGKAGALLDIAIDPVLEIERAEHELEIAIDLYFEHGIYCELFKRLFDAALELGDAERMDRAMVGLLFFTDINKRVEYLLGYAETLAKRKRYQEVFAFVGEGIRACDELKHASSREQAAFKLATTALAASRGRTPRAKLKDIASGIPIRSRGVTGQLFRIVCHLNLAAAAPALRAEARQLFMELRASYPAEGESIERFFEQANSGAAGR